MGSVQLTQAIEDFTTYLRAERGFSDHTVRSYRSDLVALATFAQQCGVEDVGGISLELLRDWLWQGSQAALSPATLARRSAAARALTSWLARSGETETNAGIRLKAPKAGHHLPRVLTREQINSIFGVLSARAAGGDPVSLRNLAVVELLYASALRVSEATGLDLSSVDLGRLTVRVLGKGAKERVVPFGVPASRAVAAYLDGARPVLAEKSGRRRPRCSSANTAPDSGCAPSTLSCRGCSPASRVAARRDLIRCGTLPRHICSTVVRTCGPCRRCSATRAWEPPRFTRTCRRSGSRRATGWRIRGPNP